MSEAGTALGGKEAGGFWAVTAVVIALAVGAAADPPPDRLDLDRI